MLFRSHKHFPEVEEKIKSKAKGLITSVKGKFAKKPKEMKYALLSEGEGFLKIEGDGFNLIPAMPGTIVANLSTTKPILEVFKALGWEVVKEETTPESHLWVVKSKDTQIQVFDLNL